MDRLVIPIKPYALPLPIISLKTRVAEHTSHFLHNDYVYAFCNTRFVAGCMRMSCVFEYLSCHRTHQIGCCRTQHHCRFWESSFSCRFDSPPDWSSRQIFVEIFIFCFQKINPNFPFIIVNEWDKVLKFTKGKWHWRSSYSIRLLSCIMLT